MSATFFAPVLGSVAVCSVVCCLSFPLPNLTFPRLSRLTVTIISYQFSLRSVSQRQGTDRHTDRQTDRRSKNINVATGTSQKSHRWETATHGKQPGSTSPLHHSSPINPIANASGTGCCTRGVVHHQYHNREGNPLGHAWRNPSR